MAHADGVTREFWKPATLTCLSNRQWWFFSLPLSLLVASESRLTKEFDSRVGHEITAARRPDIIIIIIMSHEHQFYTVELQDLASKLRSKG